MINHFQIVGQVHAVFVHFRALTYGMVTVLVGSVADDVIVRVQYLVKECHGRDRAGNYFGLYFDYVAS